MARHVGSMNVGDRIGRLTIIGPIVTKDGKESFSPCRCDCGAEKLISRSPLRRGAVVSCGCYGREARRQATFKHGQSVRGPGRRLYGVWASMKQRCENPNDPHYQWYGARGIKVCERWRNFENFFADVGVRPRGMTLDRIDNDGDYEPGNWRWATQKQQIHNNSTTHFVKFAGEHRPLRDIEDMLGLSPKLIGKMMHKKQWSAERAVAYYAARVQIS